MRHIPQKLPIYNLTIFVLWFHQKSDGSVLLGLFSWRGMFTKFIQNKENHIVSHFNTYFTKKKKKWVKPLLLTDVIYRNYFLIFFFYNKLEFFFSCSCWDQGQNNPTHIQVSTMESQTELTITLQLGLINNPNYFPEQSDKVFLLNLLNCSIRF